MKRALRWLRAEMAQDNPPSTALFVLHYFYRDPASNNYRHRQPVADQRPDQSDRAPGFGRNDAHPEIEHRRVGLAHPSAPDVVNIEVHNLLWHSLLNSGDRITMRAQLDFLAPHIR